MNLSLFFSVSHMYTYNLQFYISQFIVQARETFDCLYSVLVLDPTSATASGGMNLPREKSGFH